MALAAVRSLRTLHADGINGASQGEVAAAGHSWTFRMVVHPRKRMISELQID